MVSRACIVIGGLAIIFAMLVPGWGGGLNVFLNDWAGAVPVMGLVIMLGGLVLLQVERKRAAKGAKAAKAAPEETEKPAEETEA